MRNAIGSFIFIFILASGVLAQTNEAQQIDEFGVLPCGDMLMRLHNTYLESQKSPYSKIYVIYYGGRFRKETLWNKQGAKIRLKYPHRDDALNRAKAITLYLTTEKSYSVTERDAFKERVVLINGGFRQNLEMEIWIVPKDAAPPKPSPTIGENDVKFRTDKPFGTPDFKRCYDDY